MEIKDTITLAQNISSLFDFDQTKKSELVTFESQISAWENKSSALVGVPTKDIKTIQDKDFMDAAFKSLIKVGMRALEKMELDLKLGSPSKDKEALAMMQTAVAESLEKMQNYLFKLQEMEMFQAVPAQQTNVQANIFNIEASSSDMMDLIDKAKERSELKSVEAKFKIDTEKSY